MPIDRRGFMRVVAAAVGLLAARRSQAARAEGWTLEIHLATRNTILGAIGARLAGRPRVEGRFKVYAGRPRIALPVASSEDERALADVLASFAGGAVLGADPLDLATLSRVLQHTNGVTGSRSLRKGVLRLRAAPSAGALYAGEIYVVADRVRGLEPGVYYYQPVQHALVALSDGPSLESLKDAVEQPGRIGAAPAAILLTNVFGRYGWRYANRGYRYALIDSGHIGENLRLVARSAGLADVSPLRFEDDRLNELLAIDGRSEAVCAVHAIGRAQETTAEVPGVRRLAERQDEVPGDVPAKASLTERYHVATGLVRAGATRSPGVAPKARARRGTPAKLRPIASVEECIRRRRSAPGFGDREISREHLDWMLAGAGGSPALTRAPGVDLAIVVHRVSGLARGLYDFDRASGRLEPRRLGDLRKPLVRTCIGQSMAGSCAVACFMVGELRGGDGGDRRYRDLLIECGAIGQRVYLSAEAVGLAARNLAAFRDDELNALLELDGRERAALHLTLAGVERG